MPDIKNANNAPRCEHIKYDDVRCGAPALRGRRFCRFHASARSTHEPFPTIEDGLSLQVGLNQIVRSVIDGSLERKTASLILYAFQIMCSNLKRMNEERKLASKTDEEELPGPSLAQTLLDRLDHLLDDNPPEESPVDPDPWHLNPNFAAANQKSEIGNQKWPAPPTVNQSPTPDNASLRTPASPAVESAPGLIDKLEACSQSRIKNQKSKMGFPRPSRLKPHASCLVPRPAVISPVSLRRIAYTAKAGTLIQSAAESPAEFAVEAGEGCTP